MVGSERREHHPSDVPDTGLARRDAQRPGPETGHEERWLLQGRGELPAAQRQRDYLRLVRRRHDEGLARPNERQQLRFVKGPSVDANIVQLAPKRISLWDATDMQV